MSSCKTIKGRPNIKSRAIRQYDLDWNFIAEFESIAVAARALNLDPSSILYCCRGYRDGAKAGYSVTSQHKGFRFEYKDSDYLL